MAVARWIPALDGTYLVFETTCTTLLNKLLRATPGSSTAIPHDLKDNSLYIYLNSPVPQIDNGIVTDRVANIRNTASKRETFQKFLSNVKLVHLTPVESKSSVTLKREIPEQK